MNTPSSSGLILSRCAFRCQRFTGVGSKRGGAWSRRNRKKESLGVNNRKTHLGLRTDVFFIIASSLTHAHLLAARAGHLASGVLEAAVLGLQLLHATLVALGILAIVVDGIFVRIMLEPRPPART